MRMLCRLKRVFLIAELALRLVGIHIALRLRAPKGLIAGAARSRGWFSGESIEVVWRLARGVNRRLTRKESCLAVALVAYALAERGTRLHLGVLRRGNELEAHAWLVGGGKVYSTSEEWPRYHEIGIFEKGGRIQCPAEFPNFATGSSSTL
jgi:hypothetical protein